MMRYQGETVDFQEGPSPVWALWGAGSGCSSDLEQENADGVAISHLNLPQQDLLAALEPAGQDDANVESAAIRGRGGKKKPLRHQLHRTPTATQKARWEAVQYAREQGLSLRAISRTLGIAKNTVKKYMSAESPPAKELSAKERAKAEALSASPTETNEPG